MTDTISAEIIEKKIYLIRGHKIMLDRDLAEQFPFTKYRHTFPPFINSTASDP